MRRRVRFGLWSYCDTPDVLITRANDVGIQGNEWPESLEVEIDETSTEIFWKHKFLTAYGWYYMTESGDRQLMVLAS